MKLPTFALVSAALSLLGPAASAQSLNAAGGTFPAPIYFRWFQQFHAAHSKTTVAYQAIGSGAGIKEIIAGVIDFGASDMPMTEEQMAAMQAKPLHFPTVLGAVVPTYNLGSLPEEVKFTPEILAGIFSGRIRSWNDPQIKTLNPNLNFPAEDIVAVHRSDSSGTTFVFSDYLSKTTPTWKNAFGSGTTVNWAGGVGDKGNDGVAARVKHTPGAIGYVELTYAIQKGIPYGLVRNASGTFVKASLASVTAAARGAAANMPADFRVSITDAPGKDAYPISTFTWLMVPAQIGDAAKRKAIVELLQWVLTTGQKECASLGYAPLPREVARQELKQIDRLQAAPLYVSSR